MKKTKSVYSSIFFVVIFYILFLGLLYYVFQAEHNFVQFIAMVVGASIGVYLLINSILNGNRQEEEIETLSREIKRASDKLDRLTNRYS